MKLVQFFRQKNALIILLLVIVLSLITALSAFIVINNKSKPAKVGLANVLSECTDSKAVEMARPNVVRIENRTDSGSIIGTGFFEPSGYLITNSHVVDTKGEITVFYANGKSTKANLVANSLEKDVAILSVATADGNALAWGKSDILREPDTLIAIGYGLNLPGSASVTKGSFSAKRNFNDLNYIQTDTALNYGNSGGPLINTCGQVIGINTLSIENASVNLALASEDAQKAIESLISNKNVAYFTGGKRAAVVNDLLKTIGLEIPDNTDIFAATQDPSEIKVTPDFITQNPSNKNVLNGTVKITSNTSSQTTTGTANSSSSSATITCNGITSSKSILEIDENALLFFSFSGIPDQISWSGGGTLQPTPGLNSSSTWQSDAAGDFTVKVTAKTKGYQCQSEAKLTVLPPATRIEGLVKIDPPYMLRTYSDYYKQDVFQIDAVSFLNSNNVNVCLSQERECRTTNYSAEFIVYDPVTNGSEMAKVYYRKTFTKSQMDAFAGYKINGSVYIQIPLDELISAACPAGGGASGTPCNRYQKLIIHTPEQGDFESWHLGNTISTY